MESLSPRNTVLQELLLKTCCFKSSDKPALFSKVLKFPFIRVISAHENILLEHRKTQISSRRFRTATFLIFRPLQQDVFPP